MMGVAYSPLLCYLPHGKVILLCNELSKEVWKNFYQDCHSLCHENTA